MDWFNLLIKWMHFVAAFFWVGGMLFLSLVVVPVFKSSSDPGKAQPWFLVSARRFRSLVWIGIPILLVTGGFLLPDHVDFSSSVSTWPLAVFVKLTLVVLLIATSISHDRIIGPQVRTIKQKASIEWTSGERLLVKCAPWIGRLTMILGLAVVLVGVLLVRG